MAARRESDSLPAEVRAELRAGREALGLSRDAFAVLLGMSKQQVKQVELGGRTPSPKMESRWRSLAGLSALDTPSACGCCGGQVLKSAKVPHHRAATVDHLVPLSDGGADTLQNVALAHFICNTRRGVGGEAQLRLTG